MVNGKSLELLDGCACACDVGMVGMSGMVEHVCVGELEVRRRSQFTSLVDPQERPTVLLM